MIAPTSTMNALAGDISPADPSVPALTSAPQVKSAMTRHRVYRASRRHSLMVRVLRILLPVAGISALFGLIVIINILPKIGLGLDLGDMTLSFNGSTIVMNDPKLNGFGNNGQAYEVRAQSASQSILNPQRIALEGLSADITLSDGAWAKVRSASGLYDNGDQILRLDEAINLTSSESYTVRLQHALIDLKAGTMTSNAPLEVRSETGFMQANRIVVDESGQRIRFLDGVRLVIVPPQSDGRLVVE